MARRRSNRRVSSGAAALAASRRRRNILWIGALAGAVLVSVVLIVILALGNRTSSTPATEGIASLPDFEVLLYQGEGRLGGDELRFSSLQGQPIVLNFWAGLCPPCRAEMPGFQRFYDDTKDDALLIGIDVGQFTGLGNRSDARDLLEELRVSYPAGFTNDRSVMRDYQVRGMPTTVFISAEGEIVQTWNGPLDEDTLRAFTHALLLDDTEPAS